MYLLNLGIMNTHLLILCAQSKNRDSSEIVMRKVEIPILQVRNYTSRALKLRKGLD